MSNIDFEGRFDPKEPVSAFGNVLEHFGRLVFGPTELQNLKMRLEMKAAAARVRGKVDRTTTEVLDGREYRGVPTEPAIPTGPASPMDYLSVAAQIPERAVSEVGASIRRAFEGPGRALRGEMPVMEEGRATTEAIGTALDIAGAQLATSVFPGRYPVGSLGVFGSRLNSESRVYKRLTKDLDRLRTEGLDVEKASAPKTLAETGLSRDYNGNWVLEIDDSAASLKGEIGTEAQPISEVFDHPDLFDAFPYLRDYKVQRVEGVNYQGEIDLDNKLIKLGARGTDDDVSVLLHEVQHAVQWNELMKGERRAVGETTQKDWLVDSVEKLGRVYSRIKEKGLIPEDKQIVFEDLLAELQTYYDYYKANPGEVEARNTQFRRDWSVEERRSVLPEFTEDLPRGSQLELADFRNIHRKGVKAGMFEPTVYDQTVTAPQSASTKLPIGRTRGEAISIIQSRASTELKDELAYFRDLDRDYAYDDVMALFDAQKRVENAIADAKGEPSQAQFMKGYRSQLSEIRDILIELGFYRKMSKEEIENTFVSSGQVWEFKKNGEAYTTDHTIDDWFLPDETMSPQSASASWRKPPTESLQQEYKVEYQNHFRPAYGDVWPSEASFIKAVEEAPVVALTPEMDARIGNRSHTQTFDDLHGLISGYRSYPEYRNVDTLTALDARIRAGEATDMPIITVHPNGSMRVLSGNTRLDLAAQAGKPVDVVMLKVPEAPRVEGTRIMSDGEVAAEFPDSASAKRAFDELFSTSTPEQAVLLALAGDQAKKTFNPLDYTFFVMDEGKIIGSYLTEEYALTKSADPNITGWVARASDLIRGAREKFQIDDAEWELMGATERKELIEKYNVTETAPPKVITDPYELQKTGGMIENTMDQILEKSYPNSGVTPNSTLMNKANFLYLYDQITKEQYDIVKSWQKQIESGPGGKPAALITPEFEAEVATIENTIDNWLATGNHNHHSYNTETIPLSAKAAWAVADGIITGVEFTKLSLYSKALDQEISSGGGIPEWVDLSKKAPVVEPTAETQVSTAIPLGAPINSWSLNDITTYTYKNSQNDLTSFQYNKNGELVGIDSKPPIPNAVIPSAPGAAIPSPFMNLAEGAKLDYAGTSTDHYLTDKGDVYFHYNESTDKPDYAEFYPYSGGKLILDSDQINFPPKQLNPEKIEWREYFSEDWMRIHETLVSEERRAFSDYASSSYDLNRALARSPIASQPLSFYLETIKALDEGVAKGALPNDMELYRGVPSSYWQILKNSEVGDIIEHVPYISSSIKETKAREFGEGLLIMRMPKGFKGMVLGDLSPHRTEKELVLPRGVRFRIVAKSYGEVIVEPLPYEGPPPLPEVKLTSMIKDKFSSLVSDMKDILDND